MRLVDQMLQKPQAVQAVRLIICALSACLIASARLGGVLIPLPTAFAAALPPMYALVMLAGSLFTYFLSGSISYAPMLICALVLAVLARWVLGERNRPLLAASIAGASTLISVVMFGFAGLVEGADWMIWLIGVPVSFGLAYCAGQVRLCCEYGFPLRLHGKDGLYCGVCYVALMAALCSADLVLLNIGQILSGFLTLAAARRYRTAGGVICGTLSAAAILLADGKAVGFAAVLGIAGAVSGCFGNWKKGGVFAVYQVVCGFGVLLTARTADTMQAWLNGMIGGLLFLFVPVSQLADSLLYWADTDTDLAALSGARMEFLSGAIGEVRKGAERIVQMLEQSEPVYEPAARVSELVCSRCSSYTTCWETEETRTKQCFRKMADAGVLEHTDGPEGCLKPERLTEEFYRVKRRNAFACYDAAKLRDTQELLFSQLQISEMLLRRSAGRMQQEYHREQSRCIKDMLERFGIPVRAAAVHYSPSRRMTIELYLRLGKDLEADTVTEYLQDMLRIPLECKEVRVRNSEQRIVLRSFGGYRVETAAAQCAVHEDEPCGDSFSTFSDSEGNFYLAVSDGMGSGRLAAVDAKLVLHHFKELVQSGMDCEDAAKIVNAVMLTKSGEERFATLDVVKIDTETAEMRLYKYGAGPTLVKHGDHVTVCQAATNPIGILPNAEPYSTALKLEAGDFIFLLSDGLDEKMFPYIRRRLLDDGEQDLQSLAHAVCAKAQRDAKGAPRDDVTVLAAYIGKDCEPSD